MLECGDGSIYAGLTSDLERRVYEHQSGHGAKHVRTKGLTELIWKEQHPNRESAEKREARIKR
ncbi:MAG: GIY-YIG nuclease family protein [Elusimicrobiota bacterium]|jgi:putative endonuclease